MAQPSPWSRFVDSAVRGQGCRAPAASGQPTVAPAPSRQGAAGAGCGGIRREEAARPGRSSVPSRCSAAAHRRPARTPALLVWGAAVAGVWLTPDAGVAVRRLLVGSFPLPGPRGRSSGPAAGFLTTPPSPCCWPRPPLPIRLLLRRSGTTAPFAEAVAPGSRWLRSWKLPDHRVPYLPGTAGRPSGGPCRPDRGGHCQRPGHPNPRRDRGHGRRRLGTTWCPGSWSAPRAN